MPRKRRTTLPKPYGRQAEGKTIKSLSLDADLVKWSEGQAAAKGISFSAWMNNVLARERGPVKKKAKAKAKGKK